MRVIVLPVRAGAGNSAPVMPAWVTELPRKTRMPDREVACPESTEMIRVWLEDCAALRGGAPRRSGAGQAPDGRKRLE